MKYLILGFLIFNITQTHAEEASNVVQSATINVDGFVPAEVEPTDNELQTIHAEIKRQRTETALNKEKAKNFKQLSKSVEQLSETTVEYLEEKKAAKQQIAEYNEKVKCLQSEAPGPECDRYVKRR